MNKKDIASIYKVLILYENLNNEDITIDSYLNYIDICV